VEAEGGGSLAVFSSEASHGGRMRADAPTKGNLLGRLGVASTPENLKNNPSAVPRPCPRCGSSRSRSEYFRGVTSVLTDEWPPGCRHNRGIVGPGSAPPDAPTGIIFTSGRRPLSLSFSLPPRFLTLRRPRAERRRDSSSLRPRNNSSLPVT